MTATTKYFQELQQIYIKKAQSDREQMLELVKTISAERGLTTPIPDDYFLIFCKNCKNLEVTKMRSLEEEITAVDIPEDFQWSLHDDEECHLWYLVARVIEEFRQDKGYYAGMADHNDDSEKVNKDRTELEF